MLKFGTIRKIAHSRSFNGFKCLKFRRKSQAPLRVKTEKTAFISGREIHYTLTISGLARVARLKITPKAGLEVVIPRRYRLSAVPELLREKEDWIIRHLDTMAIKKKSALIHFHDGGIIRLFGEPYVVRFLPTIQKQASVKERRVLKFNADHAEESGGEILVYSRSLSNANVPISNQAGASKSVSETAGAKNLHAQPRREEAALESAKYAFENFCRQKARQYFARRVPEIAQIMGVNFGRITVRGQQSRWGSCSRENNLNFNWRLAFYEKEVADYVIYHELSHTVHHNHSSQFYAFLQHFCPNYKLLRKKLREGTTPF
jgi:predicted metal-dependent hydrolase